MIALRIRNGRAAACIAAVALGLVPSSAAAQVNAEAIRSQLAKDTQLATVDASLVTRAGNTQGTTFGGGVLAAIVKRRHLAFGRAQADYANAQGETTVSRAFAHARYNYTLIEQLALEGFAQLQSDRFRRLAFREVLGAGPRWEIVRRNHFELFAATAYMLENEVLLASTGPPDPRREDFYHRSSSYFGVNYVIDEKSQITAVTYLQPRFDRPKDFRVLHESALILGVTKLLAVKLGMTFRYDSEPPIAVEPMDIEIKNSLQLRF